MTAKISIIVPAYQAAATLAATLRSALGQTHGDLEVLVVDDGSSDATRAVAERVAATDARVRVFSQANSGVAAARNLAIDYATGDYIAPLDADDVWHPRKLQMQLDRFDQGGSRLGLVYNWHRTIDADDRVRLVSTSPLVEGPCLLRHLAYNFISTGSTPLIRRAALGQLRYDPGLALAGAGGCEDYLLQLQVAREWEFALVPAWLTGYRKAGTTMSSDVGRMIRSHLVVLGMMREGLGRSGQRVIDRRIARLQVEFARERLDRARPAEAVAALAEATRYDPLRLPRYIAEEAVAALREKRAVRCGRLFGEYAVDEVDGTWPFKLAGPMARLAPLDEARARALRARMPGGIQGVAGTAQAAEPWRE